MLSPRTLLLPLSLLSLIPTLVSAHGFVHQVTIQGKVYTGNTPNANPQPSVIRQINDVGPVKGASNPEINCGHDAQFATQVANANPGDNFQFDWTGGDLSNWPHNTGPMLTYMTSCGSTACDKFNSSSAKWFKIDQVGLKADGNTWFQQDLMNGGQASVNLPSNIAPGNYLIRHEIIALHLATEFGGAEFYPSCTQLTIGGNGNGAPQPSELVTLPGAYSDNDPGIFDPDVFNQGQTYIFPGPPVAAFVTGSSSSSNSNSTSASGSSSPSATASATSSGSSAHPTSASSNSGSTSSGTKGSCHLKKKTSSNNTTTTNLNANRPRHISRIMRGLNFRRSALH